VLLHGPPGTRKTTLARSLAQHMAIRLLSTFQKSLLIEVNAANTFSKWLGESAKIMSAILDDIERKADKDTLVCVLIDEVESVASSREGGMDKGEALDGLRLTNQLLVGLDRLKPCSNVVLLCTCNFPRRLDAAFVDRIDIVQEVLLCGAGAIYTLLRGCLRPCGKLRHQMPRAY
ncbi:AAA ATPase, partial [Tothia fuscella]